MKVSGFSEDQQLEKFLGDVFDVSEKVGQTFDSEPVFIQIAGVAIQLAVPNPILAAIVLPPLAHIRVDDPIEVDATITIWDSQAAGVGLPDMPWGVADGGERETADPLDGPTFFYNHDEWTMAYQSRRKALSVAKINEGQAVFWVPDVAALQPMDGRPLRTLFQWLLGRQGGQIVHAGAVGRPDGGVLVTGKSGAGKSTLVTACLNSNLKLAGDENVAVSTEGALAVHSLYNSVNLDERSVGLLPMLAEKDATVQEARIDKNLYFLFERFPEKFIGRFPLKAIVVPQIGGVGASKIEPLAGAAALTALAPTSVFQVPGNKQEAFFRMSRMVKQTPCLLLTIGETVADAPHLLEKLLEDLV